MTQHRDEHIDLCAGYALGSLDEADRRRLEEHLHAGCPACDAAIADFSGTAVMLARGAPPAKPSPGLRARVMEAVRSDAARPAATEESREAIDGARERPPRGREAERAQIRELRPRPRFGWIHAVGWVAAAVLAVTAGTFWEAISRLRYEVKVRDELVSELRNRVQVEQRWVAILSAPGARVAEMTLTPEGRAALQGRAVYDPDTQRALVVFRNALAPSDKDYELWAIRDAGPSSLGVLRADESGNAVLRLENLSYPTPIQAFAVSLEPRGGSPNSKAPSGPVIMVGALGS